MQSRLDYSSLTWLTDSVDQRVTAMTFLFDIENEQNQHLEGAPRRIHIFQADAPL